MNWLIGCLNSGLKQGGKLLLAILTTYVTGVHLDWKSLATVYAVGFVWGIVEYQISNPIPDVQTVTTTTTTSQTISPPRPSTPDSIIQPPAPANPPPK